MNPLLWKWGAIAAVVLALIAGSGAAVWEWQANAYGKQLADQARNHQADLTLINNAGNALARTEQDKRLALEQRLQASEQTHYKELSDAQRDQGRLRDRLATSDLRLSVLLAASDSGGGGVQATTGPGGVVHGATRAQLDPAHAQRIIGITSDGDRGLIALAACQAYVRGVIR